MFKKNGSMRGTQLASTFIIIILVVFNIYFPNKSGVGGVGFLTNSISPNDPIIKAWEYGMILYFIEIPNPKFPFFSRLTKFQQCLLRRIHWILTSPKGPTKIPISRCLNLKVYGALIEYENGKAKSAHYFIQIVDYDDLNDQQQEWIPEHRELITDSALVRAIGFFNIYHQCWTLIEQGTTLMHCGNTAFAYDNKFKDYMKMDKVVSEDIFDCLFDV